MADTIAEVDHKEGCGCLACIRMRYPALLPSPLPPLSQRWYAALSLKTPLAAHLPIKLKE